MTLFFSHPEDVAAYVAQFAGKPFHQPYSTIGVHREGTLVGGFVFTGFNGDCVEVSVAGRGIASRSAWRAVVAYVFDQLKCSRLQMHTRRSNKAVKQILPKFGMRYEGIARRFYGKEDGIVYSLTIDDLNGFKARWRL